MKFKNLNWYDYLLLAEFIAACVMVAYAALPEKDICKVDWSNLSLNEQSIINYQMARHIEPYDKCYLKE